MVTPRLRAMRRWTLPASPTLYLPSMYLKMAWREEPVRSLSDLMASAIIAEYLGWVAAFLALPEAACGEEGEKEVGLAIVAWLRITWAQRKRGNRESHANGSRAMEKGVP